MKCSPSLTVICSTSSTVTKCSSSLTVIRFTSSSVRCSLLTSALAPPPQQWSVPPPICDVFSGFFPNSFWSVLCSMLIYSLFLVDLCPVPWWSVQSSLFIYSLFLVDLCPVPWWSFPWSLWFFPVSFLSAPCSLLIWSLLLVDLFTVPCWSVPCSLLICYLFLVDLLPVPCWSVFCSFLVVCFLFPGPLACPRGQQEARESAAVNTRTLQSHMIWHPHFSPHPLNPLTSHPPTTV